MSVDHHGRIQPGTRVKVTESETIEGCLDKIEKALDRPAPEGE